MTKEEKAHYRPSEELREALNQLKGEKFRLDCGHHVTFGFFSCQRHNNSKWENSRDRLSGMRQVKTKIKSSSNKEI